MVNVPSVFESLKFYCIYLWSDQTLYITMCYNSFLLACTIVSHNFAIVLLTAETIICKACFLLITNPILHIFSENLEFARIFLVNTSENKDFKLTDWATLVGDTNSQN